MRAFATSRVYIFFKFMIHGGHQGSCGRGDGGYYMEGRGGGVDPGLGGRARVFVLV